MFFKNTRNKFSQVRPNLWLAMHQHQVKNHKPLQYSNQYQNTVGKKVISCLFELLEGRTMSTTYPKMSIHTVTVTIHPRLVREKVWMKQWVSHRTVSATLCRAVQSVPASCVSTWARQGDVSMPHLLVCSHEKEVVGGKLSGACHNVPLQDPPRSFSAGVPLHHILLYFSPPPTALPARALLCAPCHYA